MFDHPEDGRRIDKSGLVHELSTPKMVIFLFKLGILRCTMMDTTWHNRVAGYGTQASSSLSFTINALTGMPNEIAGCWNDHFWVADDPWLGVITGIEWGWLLPSGGWKGTPIHHLSQAARSSNVQANAAAATSRRNWGRHRGHKNQQAMRTQDAALEVSSCRDRN